MTDDPSTRASTAASTALASARPAMTAGDAKAFVVVTGAQDVRGEGFRPLEA